MPDIPSFEDYTLDQLAAVVARIASELAARGADPALLPGALDPEKRRQDIRNMVSLRCLPNATPIGKEYPTLSAERHSRCRSSGEADPVRG